MRRAVKPQAGVRLVGEPIDQGLGEARLADPGINPAKVADFRGSGRHPVPPGRIQATKIARAPGAARARGAGAAAERHASPQAADIAPMKQVEIGSPGGIAPTRFS
jgi:hypothetical protein